MHLVRSATPCVALRNYVRAYLQRQIRGFPGAVVEPGHARLEAVLHFNLGGDIYLRKSGSEIGPVYPASVVGHQTRRRFELLMFEGTEAFAVFFEPTRLTQLFRTPARYLVDQEIEAGSVLGDSISALRSRIGEAATFEGRVCIIEDFLLRQVARSGGRNRFALAAEHVFAARGVVRIHKLAQQIGLSQRQFERRFAAETGCSPKLYARVARFQTALDMKIAAPERSWMEIAHTLDYHDQMHLVHDFRTLTGSSPDRFIGELGEARPQAVASINAGQTLQSTLLSRQSSPYRRQVDAKESGSVRG